MLPLSWSPIPIFNYPDYRIYRFVVSCQMARFGIIIYFIHVLVPKAFIFFIFFLSGPRGREWGNYLFYRPPAGSWPIYLGNPSGRGTPRRLRDNYLFYRLPASPRFHFIYFIYPTSSHARRRR